VVLSQDQQNDENFVMAHYPKHKIEAESPQQSDPKTIDPPKEADHAKRSVSSPAQKTDPLAPWVAWSAIIVVPLTILALLVAIFPEESHKIGLSLLGEKPSHQSQPPEKLLRYTTFSVSGEFQHGYKFSDDSTVVIDRDTGHEIDAKITVMAPDSSTEVFIAKPWYQDDAGTTWQWQSQGSLRGSLDLQNKPHTFVDYTGGIPLSNSAYGRPNETPVSSTNTKLRPVATASNYP
jgi:hypothetical protein